MKLIEEISTLIDVECAKKKTNKSKLSEKLGKNPKYLSNMFKKNKKSIDVVLLCDIAIELDCELTDLIPNLDLLKTIKKEEE